jgi:hypothetical protein
MLIKNGTAYLSKIVPFRLEAMSSSSNILLKSSFIDLRIVGKVTFNIGNLLVTDIFLLDITKDIIMKFSIKTEKHL